ncbi:alpha/beta hydrolase [Pseudomonas sp. gcc21]|nr:alpha/beta hydrolase [Pseudomonas sp. gcc21]
MSDDDSDSDTPATPAPPQVREHDKRAFTAELPEQSELPAALDDAAIYFGRYEGLQGDALYTFEVPEGWDGDGLIMWTRGYGGENLELSLSRPGLAWRQAVLDAGYAWAASSYSANWYDARAGIEDTNKLALNVIDYVERDYGERFATPSQYLISGASLGGHIAAAAVDRENMERTQFKVDYAGAAPLCQAEQNQFQWLGDYPRVMMELSGFGDRDYSEFQDLLPQMVSTLFEMDGTTPKWLEPRGPEGERLMAIAQNLTGGERPYFEYGFASPYHNVVLATGGRTGDVNGILASNGYGNEDQVYRWTNDPEPTAEEVEFNERIARVSADPDANPLRDDGVRWIPLVNGDFDIPVMTMHTLGDFYVPFRHQQLYRERAQENGNADLLVQRAIRAPGHCDFSAGEYRALVTEWLAWVNGGPKPEGDEVLDPAVVADEDYGCNFTVGERAGLAACSSLN